MKEYRPRKESVDTTRSEHLKDPQHAIIACHNTEKDLVLNLDPNNTEYVDYDEQDSTNPTHLKYAYSFSDFPPNSKDKITQNLFNCTSVVVSGVDKETGRKISFLTHQNGDVI